MGFEDRDYARSSRSSYAGPSPVAAMRMWSVTTWLIAINVAVYVLNLLGNGQLGEWGAFTIGSVIDGFQVWRFITFQFLHAGPTHLIFNMIGLYFFGPMVEGYLGPRRYLAYYLLCGVSGAALFMVFWLLSVMPGMTLDVPLVGASAGIFGILIAAAKIAPNTTVMLMFPPIPMRLKTLAWVYIAIEVLSVLQHGAFAGGELAHLGGAALGWGLINKPELLNIFDRRFGGRRRKNPFSRDDWR